MQSKHPEADDENDEGVEGSDEIDVTNDEEEGEKVEIESASCSILF